jgi:hypothetical protein
MSALRQLRRRSIAEDQWQWRRWRRAAEGRGAAAPFGAAEHQLSSADAARGAPALADRARKVVYSRVHTRYSGLMFICVLFSQGSKNVSYSHRHLCPILTGLKKCVLFSQG